MIQAFPNKIISDYFNSIRNLLYKADGRSYKCPKDPLILNNNSHSWIKGDIYDPNENSKIKLYPNNSPTEVLLDDINGFDNDDEINNYKNDFLRLPTDIVDSSDDIEINYYFYFYSHGDGKDPVLKSILRVNVLDHYFMYRADFLYKTIISKFENMVDHFQGFIKEAKVDFQFNNETKEEVILQHLITYYSDILKVKNKQISLFKYVVLSKQISDLYLKSIIEYLTLRLNILLPESDKYYIVADEDKDTQKKIDEKLVYELPDKFSLTTLGIKSQGLDIRETAILFYYLRKYSATIDYTDNSYSKIVHYLSGHSEANLRTRSGFGNIINIVKETREGVKYSNIKNVKILLEKIISDIDREIKE